MTGDHLLEATEVHVRFGGVHAVRGATVHMARGEGAVGLVGPNGSGKTTLLNALTGVVRATGAMRIEGRSVPLGRPRASRAAGLVRAFQAPMIFSELTCLENVALGVADHSLSSVGAAWFRRPAMWAGEDERMEQAAAALERVGLGHLAGETAGDLAYGRRRLVELARAVAGKPAVLLLDEPAAGLNADETANLAELLLALQASGTAMLVVEHKLDFVDRTCQRVTVLEAGAVIADGPPAAVWQDERVVGAYLGSKRHG